MDPHRPRAQLTNDSTPPLRSSLDISVTALSDPASSPQRRHSSRSAPTAAAALASRVEKPSSSRRSAVASSSSSSSARPSTMRGAAVAAGRQTSVTSDDSAEGVRLTKTGRLSKAKKGQPVHKCEHCEKIYTRAEHLRRHMLNHSTQTLRCEFEGCTKSFHRADLLARHMDEHKSAGYSARSAASRPAQSRTSPTRPVHSVGDAQQKHAMLSQNNALGINKAAQIYSPNLNPYPSPVLSGTSSPPSGSGPYWTAWTSPPSVDLSTSSVGTGFDYSMPEVCDPYPFSSPPPYPTPGLYEHDEWLSKTTMSGSRSPVSVASSGVPMWQRNEPVGRHRSMFSPSNSDYSGYQPSEPFSGDLGPIALDPAFDSGLIEDLSFNAQDLFDQDMILRAYHNHPGCLQTSMEPYESQFLEQYWAHFHPMFPIVHRPSFEAKGVSPILKGLMLAIGAHFVHDSFAQGFARMMRDVTLKLLRNRSNELSTRLWDLQSTFLAEAFSLFRARRPTIRFSAQFENLYSRLLCDLHDVFSAEPTTLVDSIHSRNDIEAITTAHRRWLCIESKRRLFLSCYILEVQQANLFQSQRSITEKDLALPCSSALWEAVTFCDWYDLAKVEPLDPHYFFDALCLAQRRKGTGFDGFRSAIIAAYFTQNQDTASHPHAQDFTHLIQQTPQMIFANHASNLAMHTPVHSLLAVSGESFVLGEKLATRDQFLEAGSILSSWASTEASRPAKYHAAELIKLSIEHGYLNLLQEEWALCLAALVFWACEMWPHQNDMPNMLSPVTRVAGKQEILSILQNVDSKIPIPWQGVRALMIWVRSRTECTIGGVVEDVNHVIRKLADGRRVEMVSS